MSAPDAMNKLQDNIWEKLQGLEGGAITQDSLTGGEFILLKNHRMSNVAKPTDPEAKDPFASDNYYYLAVEYYELGDDNVATPVQRLIARKGSEFGSA